MFAVDNCCGVEIQRKFSDVTLHTRIDGPPPTELGLEVGLPVRLKLKMEKRLGNDLETSLLQGLRLELVFYNCSREVVWE